MFARLGFLKIYLFVFYLRCLILFINRNKMVHQLDALCLSITNKIIDDMVSNGHQNELNN